LLDQSAWIAGIKTRLLCNSNGEYEVRCTKGYAGHGDCAVILYCGYDESIAVKTFIKNEDS